MEGKVLIEVQGASGLSTSEYRLFDHTAKFFGVRRVRPYVECRVEWDTTMSRTHSSRFYDGAPEDGSWFLWGETVALPVRSDFWEASRFKIRLEVFDKRELQGAVRGDSLIGTCELWLDPNTLANSPQQNAELFRNGERVGQLALSIRMEASEEMRAILATSTSCPLATVARALAKVLRAPNAADLMMDSRPQALQLSPEIEAKVRGLFQGWVQRFCARTLQLNEQETDEKTIDALRQLVRSAQEIVACCIQNSTDDVQDVVVAWLKNIFSRCAGEEAHLNEPRLRSLLMMPQEPGTASVNPQEELRGMGVNTEILQSQSNVLHAVLARLREAEQSSEEEVFTCEQIVQDGRVMPGLSVVLRTSPSGFHVFVYDTVSIRDWQGRNACDPCTRAALRAEDILPIC